MRTRSSVTAKVSWATRLSVDFALVSPVLGEYLCHAVGNVLGNVVGLAFLGYEVVLTVLLAEVGEAVTGEEGFRVYMLRFRN